jgi:phenylpropionate dioxygenase-like ring-hydroxylating dioxygenase large terminal subunit
MFLRNAWYIGLWAQDLADKPVPKTLLGDKVVFCRLQNGSIAALEDRCRHRAAPLSKGEVEGDALVCGYHGLAFDKAGICVRVPGSERIPPNANIRSYPVEERWSTIWIWMGDPELADAGNIPNLHWLSDPGWAITPGYLYLKANYQLLVDNLLDLTHVSYVHKKTIAGDPREATTPTRTERTDDGVRTGRWMIDFKPPPLFQKIGQFKGNVDRWQFVTWTPPATVFLDIGSAETGTGAPEGDRSQGFSIWSNHLITPETETTTHYHFCFARNFKIDDAEMSKVLYEGSMATFLEDLEMLEAEQLNVRGGALENMVDIPNDAAQLQSRRILRRLIEEEEAGQTQTRISA